ncbi:20S proteasome subunit alpha 2 [Rhizoctonia solani AG-3 Rhs1AP]|uniref:20S proteasome subunit alpha 2 n=1 Tax=Rhizoctonia solani AG-3 Rhs1AP TaxID=1086054 RepID=X8IXU6_9AGAM|nr:20S proteasome subunit alpha 2 [Rhizoctonia solani AG-3 Rhs1AP]
MSAAGGGGAYSFSLTTFSPSGKLVQIEHALAVVAQGTTSLGIKATNGIVIATEKKSSSILVDESAIDKVCVICPNIGIVYSGMGPDYRVLTAKARKSAQAYWKIYGEYPPTRVLVQSIATVMQEATQSGGVRPFGVSLLVAGWDSHRGPTLYQVDPSGSYWAWKASAIGKNMTNAKTFLEKRYNDDISLEDAIHTALLTLKEGFEGQMTEKTIEIGVITVPTAEEIAEVPTGGARVKPVFPYMDGPLRSVSWVSAKTGQQSVPEAVDSDLPKLAQKPPTVRSQSIRSGTSEPPKPKVHVSLARRLLFPALLPTSPLPPILMLDLSEDDPVLVELNKELYDFLALSLRAFVQTWWGQITPRDRDLMPQITRVLTHVIQDIERRASRIDLSDLVLRQVPALVDLHLSDYRVAAMRIDTAFTNTSPSPTIQGLFHMLQPHVAIQTNQEPGAPIISQIYLRQLVENILRLSLPPEDWESETERCIVREIVACVVLGNMFKKFAQPWFLHQIVLGYSRMVRKSKKSLARFQVPSVQVLVIFVLSAMQTISSLALSIISTFQYLVALTHAANRAYERRKSRQRRNTSDLGLRSMCLSIASEVVLIHVFRSRLIPFMLSRMISPASLTVAIQTGKRALFPNDGWPGPAPAEPTIEEQLLLREQLESRLGELCQPWLANVLLGNSRKIQALTIKQALDPFSESAEINSHLLVILLDLVVSELWPELSKPS